MNSILLYWPQENRRRTGSLLSFPFLFKHFLWKISQLAAEITLSFFTLLLLYSISPSPSLCPLSLSLCSSLFFSFSCWVFPPVPVSTDLHTLQDCSCAGKWGHRLLLLAAGSCESGGAPDQAVITTTTIWCVSWKLVGTGVPVKSSALSNSSWERDAGRTPNHEGIRFATELDAI